jgi:serine/threonine protein kinase
MTQIGKYELIEKIGQGAMGEVHRARDTVLGRFVAIKTMTASIGQNEDLRKRFHREAQSAARLNHPNIVTLYDFGEDQGKIFMAMELLEGSDLKDVIKLGGLSLEQKLDLMEQICDGLAAAHAASVVHRDLKPPNIHVLPGGTVKIVDFGLARLGTSDMTKTGMVMGTPNYMSPEQVRGERVDARSDVFSLGAVFYELLSNRKAFDADSLHTVLFQVLEHEPPSVRQWAPDLPEVLAPFIERALAKDPNFRFQHAGEMRAALERARQAMESGAAQEPDLLTLLEAPSASGAPAARQNWVQGSAALEPTPSHPPVGSPPVGTLSGGSTTQAVSVLGGGKRTAMLAGGAVALVILIVVGFILLRPRPEPVPSPSPAGEVENVTRQLILTKVQLARTKLEGKDYKGASAEAREVLGLDDGNAEAKAILTQVETTMKDLEDAASETREAVKAGDSDKASAAMARVIAIDPQHPVIAELSSQLNSRFKGQAEEAQKAMKKSQAAAESAKAGSQQAFGEAVALAREADALYKRGEFTGAAQRFLDARNNFDRAKRAAQEQERVASLPKPPVTRPGPGKLPSAAPSAAAASPPPVVPSAAPTSNPADETAVRLVLAQYERAIETKDVGLFKKIMPTLSGDKEKVLKDGFKLQKKGHDVRITIESVNFSGNEATIRLSRHDTVDGKPIDVMQQSVVLVKSAGGWSIRSVGQ